MTVQRRSFTLLVLVACLLLPVASSRGVGSDRAHFTSGFHLEMDGMLRNIFVRGPALVAPPGLEAASVLVTFDNDIPVRLGDLTVTRGSRRFKLDLDPVKAWQMAPERGSARKKRINFTMTEKAPLERELSMRLVRTGRTGYLTLLTAWGHRRGALTVVVNPGTGPAPEVAETVDGARIVTERGRLLLAMGDVVGAERGRGRWLELLMTLRDATVDTEGKSGVRLSKMACKLTDASLHLDIEGRTASEDYGTIGAFRDRLQNGAFGSLFKRINIEGQGAVPGSDGKTEAFRFSMQADAPPARWQSRRVDVVLGEATGGSSTEPAKEVAHLDRRLLLVAGPKSQTGRGVSNLRDHMERLLKLPKGANVNLASVDPTPLKMRSGEVLSRYVVRMEVRGSFDGLLDFISGVHAWDAPVWATVESVEEANAGVKAMLTFEFLSYEPIETRSPGMWRALEVNHSDRAFLEQTTAFLKRLPTTKPFNPNKGKTGLPDPFTGQKAEPRR
jgi:hypothetical protein